MKKFEYIEIEYIRYINARHQQFMEWLRTNKNDDFIDRFFGKHGRFGTFKINIFLYRDNNKIEIQGKRIIDVINSYAERGWEVIGVRNEVLKESTKYDLSEINEIEIIYSSQTFYTLKRPCNYQNKRKLQEILNCNEQELDNGQELENEFIKTLE
jgi:hypothetical protein